MEKRIRVGCYGAKGSYTYEAMERHFGKWEREEIYFSLFEDVTKAVAAGIIDYGVVPIENSSTGGITEVYDLIRGCGCAVVGEELVKIEHHLLGLPGAEMEDIDTVYSHPQALMQCQGWLSQHLPKAERRAVSSNAEGARLAATNPAWAGLASERAAAQFGLHIVSHAIQDEAYNRTRFSVICLPQTLAMPAATARDCTSIVVSVPNKPGSVHDMLTPLKKHGVSMTRFESRPAKSGKWEYYFYIDLQGHPSHVKHILGQRIAALGLQPGQHICQVPDRRAALVHGRWKAARMGQHQLAHVLPRHAHDVGHVGQPN